MRIFTCQKFLHLVNLFLIVILSQFVVFTSQALFIKIPLKPQPSEIVTTDLKDSSGETVPVTTLQKSANEKKYEQLSELNPQESELWRPEGFNRDYKIEMLEPLKIKFEKSKKIGSKEFGFFADVNGKEIFFRTSRNFRNQLLTAGILRKLGYKVPDYSYAPEVEIEFESELDKSNFLIRMDKMLLESSDWIVRQSDRVLVLRDLILTEYALTDLTLKSVLKPMVVNRRKFEALSLIWASTDINESFNKEVWFSVLVSNETAFIPSNNFQMFTPSRFDIVWLINLIKNNISVSELEKIVDQAYFPEGIELLAKEVMKSRLNSISKVFSKTEIYKNVNNSVSYKDFVINGEIIFDKYKNYPFSKTVTRFASENKVMLIDRPTLKKLGRKMLESNIVSQLLAQAHKATGFSTDTGYKILEQLDKKELNDYRYFAENGRFPTENIRLNSIPSIDGKLVYSSDFVLGQFAGTQNLAQRVDVFGYFVNGGLYKDYTKFSNPYEYYAKGKVSFVPTLGYQKLLIRVKPFFNLEDIKSGLAQNDSTFVPLWINKLFDESENDTSASRLKNFFESFRIGESLIFSETSSGNQSVQYNLPLDKNLSFFARVFADQRSVNRIHIHRISENQLHVYKGNSKVGVGDEGGFGFGLSSVIPIFSFNFMMSKPDPRVSSYIIDLKNTNPDILINALEHLFDDLEIESIRKIAMNFTVEHEMLNKKAEVQVFFHNDKVVTSDDDFTIKVNDVLQKRIFVKSVTTKASNNFFRFIGQVFNAVMQKKKPNAQYLINLAAPGLSQDGVLGSSQTKEISFEHDLSTDVENKIFDQVINFKYKYKSPRVPKDELMVLLDDLNSKFAEEQFEKNRFAATQSISMFELMTQITVSKNGVEHLMKYNSKTLEKKLESIVSEIHCPVSEVSDKSCRVPIIQMMVHLFGKIKNRSEIGDDFNIAKSQASAIVGFISYLESFLRTAELIELIGGFENVYIQSAITGYRNGDETTMREPTIFSKSIGKAHNYGQGPVRYYSDNLNLFSKIYKVLPSEILAEWVKN